MKKQKVKRRIRRLDAASASLATGRVLHFRQIMKLWKRIRAMDRRITALEQRKE